MMGLKSEYAEATVGSSFGFETDKYTMLSVACEGTEDTLEDCRYQPAGVCIGNGKAGVICHGIHIYFILIFQQCQSSISDNPVMTLTRGRDNRSGNVLFGNREIWYVMHT